MTPRSPVISIVVPSYNQGEFIGECLESIFSQRGADYEVLLLDGGSTDQTLAVVEPYRSRFAHFFSERDAGQSDAINKGLRLARGDLLTWLNSDDLYLPDALRHMAEAWRERPGAPFYMGIGYRTDRAARTRTDFYPPNFAYQREALVWGMNYILQPASFFTREALAAIGGGVDTTLHYAMDSDLWLRLAALGDPCWVPHPVALSREYTGTKTSLGAWKRLDEIQRVAARHAQNAQITPGVLAEMMRFLQEEIDANPESRAHLPPETRRRVLDLWACAAGGLRQMCGRDDGFPTEPAAPAAPPAAPRRSFLRFFSPSR